jgi:DNA-binding CsgD family transcriptional regulator
MTMRHNTLSDRELEVMRYAAEGLNNPQIGAKLGISWRTVQFHVSHVFEQLCVRTRIQAIDALVSQRRLVCPASYWIQVLVLWWLVKGPSPKQAEIVGLKAHGLDTPVIARKLFLSSRTVRNHLGILYRAMGLGPGDAGSHRGALVGAVAGWAALLPSFSEFGKIAVRGAATTLALAGTKGSARVGPNAVSDALIAQCIAEVAEQFGVSQLEARVILRELGNLLVYG